MWQNLWILLIIFALVIAKEEFGIYKGTNGKYGNQGAIILGVIILIFIIIIGVKSLSY